MLACNSEKKESGHREHEEHPEDVVEMTAEQIKVAGITYGKPEMRPIRDVLKINGLVSVSPQNLATVSAPMGGFIKSTSVTEGNAVKKGQILALIENTELIELEREFLDSKSKFEFAEAEFKRHSQLHKDEVYSTKNLQETTANYKSLKSQLNASMQKLRIMGINPDHLNEENISGTISISAPISGYLRNVNLNLGKYVSPADALFEVVNTNSLVIELALFEKDIHKVKTGQKLYFTLPNESDKQRNAQIIQVGKAVSTDKTIKAYASFEQNVPDILPGMYVNAWLEINDAQVSTLPSEAIIQFDEKNYIFIYDREKMEEGKPFTEYKMLEIAKGVSEGGYTEISLPKNVDLSKEKIVVKGAYNLMAAKKNEGEMSC
jgi:cobalt-zinc-cadmium efflux system membrane fusion protein